MNENMKIIAFGNARYKRIALNWAAYLKLHKINNYTIYSLDQEIFNFLKNQSINTELIKNDIIGIEKLYLNLVSLDIVTKEEIAAFQEQEQNLKKLQSKISSKESEFLKSN